MRAYFPRLPFVHRTGSRHRSGAAETAVVTLATFGALAFLAVVLAYWTWVWVAPRPEQGMLAGPEAPGGTASGRGLFSIARQDRNSPAPTGIAMRLLGVAAAPGGRGGYAVVQLESRETIAVREGDEVAPGVRLTEVRADGIILSRHGVRESLEWSQKNASADKK
jgi:general secretion pathway protein C